MRNAQCAMRLWPLRAATWKRSASGDTEYCWGIVMCARNFPREALSRTFQLEPPVL